MHIQRIDSARIKGYQLRIGAGGAGRTKLFSDGVWGGAQEAERAAEVAMWSLIRAGYPHGRHGNRLDNTSGVKNVYIVWKPGRREIPYLYADSHYYDKGKRRVISRSLNKHGAEDAIRQVLKVQKLKPADVEDAVSRLMQTYRRVK